MFLRMLLLLSLTFMPLFPGNATPSKRAAVNRVVGNRVVVNRASANRLIGLTLVDGRTLQPLRGFNPIRPSSRFDIARFSTNGINLIPRVRGSSISQISQIKFRVNGRTIIGKRRAPFYAFVDGRERPVPWRPAPGRYSISAQAILRSTGLTREKAPAPAAVSFNVVDSDSATTTDPAPPPPIPGKATWLSHMKQFGGALCNKGDISSLGTWEGSVWYYDGIRVFYQIGDATGDSRWNECARYVRDVYRTYVLKSNGHVPGWRVFTRGLYEDFRRTGDPLSRDAVFQLVQNSTYAASAGGSSHTLSRETAYVILGLLDAEQLGGGRSQNLGRAVNYALGHIDQWVSGRASYVQPFMVGLTSEALIAYFEQTGDGRVLSAVKRALDWIWDNGWVSDGNYFRYVVCRSGATDEVCRERGYKGIDLNLLIAPAFAWVYSLTGDRTYRERGDAIFLSGVNGAYLVGGKQFSQNYRWSNRYLEWRE